MNYIKCPKCGREDPAFDYAHVCGPVEVKQTVMNERIRELAEQVYGSADYDDFKFAELIVQECVNVLYDNELWNRHVSHALQQHFGVESWTN